MNMNRSPEHVGLHADLRLFEAIVEQTPDAIIFADCDGMIRVWNRGAETVFGFSAAEVIGSSLDVIIPERFRRAHWEGFHQAIERGHTQHGGQVRTTRSIHKLGHTLYVMGTGHVSVTRTMHNWRAHAPGVIPLPHPSPRNVAWFKANPWFEDELLPVLRQSVRKLIGD